MGEEVAELRKRVSKEASGVRVRSGSPRLLEVVGASWAAPVSDGLSLAKDSSGLVEKVVVVLVGFGGDAAELDLPMTFFPAFMISPLRLLRFLFATTRF